MPMKRYKPEQIVTLLRQIEVEIANGKTTPQACKEAEITQQAYYRWRKRIRRARAGTSKTTEGAGEGEPKTQATGGGAVAGEADFERRGGGKLLSPERRRGAVRHARENYQVSERHACRLLGQWRGIQRYELIHRTDEDALTRNIVALASEYGRYGYRRISALLREGGWHVGKDRVQRIWRRGG
jgi:hypothetical protein